MWTSLWDFHSHDCNFIHVFSSFKKHSRSNHAVVLKNIFPKINISCQSNSNKITDRWVFYELPSWRRIPLYFPYSKLLIFWIRHYHTCHNSRFLSANYLTSSDLNNQSNFFLNFKHQKLKHLNFLTIFCIILRKFKCKNKNLKFNTFQVKSNELFINLKFKKLK